MAQAVLQWRLRGITDGGVHAVEAGAGGGDIRRLGGEEVEPGGPAEELLQHADEKPDLDGPVVAEVENADGRGGAGGGRIKQHFHHPIDNVVDKGEIALLPALGKEIDR